MQKENKAVTIILSSREVVARDLPHPMPLFNEEKQPCFMQKVEDPQQKLLGMTPNFTSGLHPTYNSNGFTLIELLVVVLIIGILAAVALPQYNKAVEKSRATEALTLLKSVYLAQKAYHLANGYYAPVLDELAIDIPWPSVTPESVAYKSSYSNGEWKLSLYKDSNGDILMIHRTNGKYEGGGFKYNISTYYTPVDTLLCFEAIPTFQGNAGDYCQKLFHATPNQTYSGGRDYIM